MVGREVAIALHHRQRPPAAERLDTAEINTGHHEPAGERMPVAVPGVPVEPACILPRIPEGFLRSLHGLREEAVRG